MIGRRLPERLVAVLLAVLAMVSMVNLSGWHASSFDGFASDHMGAALHEELGSQAHPNGAAHLAAHAVSQAVSIPDEGLRGPTLFSDGNAWFQAAIRFRLIDGPLSLLRPPRIR